ncbi:MAG TPA: helix-turn-helix domain-containing protein [Roseomonas sp.]|nr:helix-turn-helix domain-containing protein [Roseomonas sp.]
MASTSEDQEEVATPAARGDGSIGRIFDILDLFSVDLPVLRVEDVLERLGYTKSTAYRYLRTLCDVGLLAQAGNGFYSLGPRVIELDRMMHLTDPLLQAGQRIMPGLSSALPNSIVLLSSLYRDRVLCVHKEGPERIQAGSQSIQILRARGLPLPLFRGAASLVILASLPAYRIRSLYLLRQAEIVAAGLGPDWREFRGALARLRRKGHMTTVGQFNPSLAAIAVPVLSRDRSQVRGSLTRVMARGDYNAAIEADLVADLQSAATQIAAQLP